MLAKEVQAALFHWVVLLYFIPFLSLAETCKIFLLECAGLMILLLLCSCQQTQLLKTFPTSSLLVTFLEYLMNRNTYNLFQIFPLIRR